MVAHTRPAQPPIEELTRVHGDEDTTGGAEFDLSALKHEPLGLVLEGLEDGQDLLGHYRQHLNVDTVELIKTAPGTSLQEQRGLLSN